MTCFWKNTFFSFASIEKRTKAWTKIFSNPKPKNETFVADEAGKILGFCNVGPSRDTDALHDSGEIHAIYISPDKHSRGMGSALMKAGLKFLKAEGFKTATLWVLKSNTSTIKFYESKGWQADGKEKRDEKDNFYFEEVRYRIYL